jgi:hypothetical protein
MLEMYVAELGSTGYFVASSMRVFHGLSAGRIAHPPNVGTPPELPPLELPLLLPEPLLLPLPELLPPLLLPLLPPLLDPLPLLELPLLLDVLPPLDELPPLEVLPPLDEPPLLDDPVPPLLLLPCPPLLLLLLEPPPSGPSAGGLPSPESPPAQPPTSPAHTQNDTRARERITDLRDPAVASPGPARDGRARSEYPVLFGPATAPTLIGPIRVPIAPIASAPPVSW